MDDADLRLDGNAAAGVLAELFGTEMTVSWSACAGCGAERQLGALLAYVHGMGTVLRCPDCDTALLRVAEPPGRRVLDLRGLAWLQVTPHP